MSVVPFGSNMFGSLFERVLPASSVANMYPFNFSGKTDPHGFYIGRDKYGTNILVDFDRRTEDKTNSNVLILGNSGQGNEKSAIFVVMPEEDPNKFFMVSLIIQQLYREILAVADENNGKLKNRCVFYCDEFGTLPKIESAEMMFSASRSRRLQIVPIIQSFAQLEKNYGKEGADVIVDNTQLTIFGGFAPNSTSAETLSKALGSRTVMSGSVSRSKDNPSQSVQMIERPLMTADELKNLPKGTFVVMKTAKHPMKVKLKLFFMWGIKFEKPYMVSEQGNRKVRYVSQSDLVQRVKNKYKDYPTITERTVSDTKDDVFDNDIPSASVTSTPTSNKGIGLPCRLPTLTAVS